MQQPKIFDKSRFIILECQIKNMNTFTAIIQKDEEMYVAKCPEIGTVSQGKTIEEALKNLKEATEAYLEEMPYKIGYKPIMTTFEVEGHANPA